MVAVVIRPARAHEAASITELALRSKAHWAMTKRLCDRWLMS
ncbi:hypothetical protein [Laceyella sediminis]|nr:hypothetical protein [Laceyella sediminis]